MSNEYEYEHWHARVQSIVIVMLLIANAIWWITWNMSMQAKPADVLFEVKKMAARNEAIDARHMEHRQEVVDLILRELAELKAVSTWGKIKEQKQ